MIAMQASFYLCLGCWVTLFSFIAGSELSLAALFDHNYLSLDKNRGWTYLLITILTAPCVYVANAFDLRSALLFLPLSLPSFQFYS